MKAGGGIRRYRRKGPDLRTLLVNRHRGRMVCDYCRRSVARDQFTIEHATPKSRGGSDGLDNLVPSCRTCDHLKGPLTADEFRSVMNDDVARKQLIREVHAQLREAS